MELSKKYFVDHQDDAGEWHSIGDAFEAESGEAAIALILDQSGAKDDGRYRAVEDFDLCSFLVRPGQEVKS